MNLENLRSKVAEYNWFHSIDLGNGLVTPGAKTPIVHAVETAAFFDRVDLKGRTFLDVGAWDGYYSFEAKRRGASRVLATDSVVWAHPLLRGRETFALARAALGLEVDALEIDAMVLSPENVGDFDVVLFSGVFYHQYDPIEGLARVARLTRQLLIVESHLDLREIDRPAMIFYPGAELASDASNWWGPNEQLIVALLRGHGFAEIETTAHPMFPKTRGVFHAWRKTNARVSVAASGPPLRPVSFHRRFRRLFGC